MPVRENVRSAWAPSAVSGAQRYSVAKTTTASFEAPARCLSEARVGASTPKAKFSTVSISAGVGKPRSMALS